MKCGLLYKTLLLPLSAEYGTKEVWGQSFDIKTMLLPWATGSVSSYSNLSNSAIPCFGRLFWYMTHMLPMDTKLVTPGNDIFLMSKPFHQTSPVP